VDSLTIQAVPSDSPDPIVSPARGRRRGADATQLLQALHKTVRSLNNLEARLYHVRRIIQRIDMGRFFYDVLWQAI
jgi:hypothetical protein